MKVRGWMATTAVVAVSLGVMTVAGARPQSGAAQQQQTTTVARSLTQRSCFQSGSGATFYRPCVSTHGNIYSIQAPSGVEHVNNGTVIEGYGICADSGYVYDAGFAESGFGAQTITQPNGANSLPLTIVRTGGPFRLTQTYALDKLQRKIDVTMAVRNSSSVSQTNVIIARFFDGDLDNTTGNDIYDKSLDAVWGRELHALALQAITLAPSHDVAIESFSQLSFGLAGGVCSIPDNAGPTAPSDWAGVASYYFPSIAAGTTKTVKFTYRIM